MANLKIKLVKSLSGRLDKHIATANSLGLRKIGQETIVPKINASGTALHPTRFVPWIPPVISPAA